MKAIFEDRERQYTVQVGDVIAIDRMSGAEANTEITFDKLMMIINDKEEATFGTPYVKGSVKATILNNEIRDPKIIVFKFKRRKNYKRTKGHKQQRTLIKIDAINV